MSNYYLLKLPYNEITKEITTQIIMNTSYRNSRKASDRFIQPIFLRLFRCIGAFIRHNACDITQSAVTCMGDLRPRAQTIAKFCAEESSKQNNYKISRTDQKSNTEIWIKPLYLSPILYSCYPISYMVSFWCGNTLLKGDFKNTKTYQNMRGQQVVRPLLFYLEKFTKFTLIYPIKYMASFWCGNILRKGMKLLG